MLLDARLDDWLAALSDRRGTDLLISAGTVPMGRVDGTLAPLSDAVVDEEAVEAMVASLLDEQQRTQLRTDLEVDFAFSWAGRARVRGSAFHQRGHCSMSLRAIPMQIPAVEDLGLPAAVDRVLRQPSGLVLVTGPTGSGKSTTLAAMLDVINSRRACHIVTIEDPIEYLHANKRAAVSQREIGHDTRSFAAALKSVLRQDPDVVLLGEMRDPESIAAALTVAETGHLVFATLHTNDSGQAVDRIVDVFPADARPQIQVQLSATLLAVLYQRLLPRADHGMVAAYEVMMGVPAVRNLIREGKSRQLRNVVATHRSEGMQTLEHHLTTLVDAGTVTREAAEAASLYPSEIARPPRHVGVA